MRQVRMVSLTEEMIVIANLAYRLNNMGYHSGNSTIVTVSSDYSSIAGQILRHKLSYNREMCNGFSIDVPYPDQTWDDTFVNNMEQALNANIKAVQNTTLILVEAAVIRGGNYQFVTNFINNLVPEAKIVTTAMYENIRSKFKSDVVGLYYDDSEYDLTFWWEEDNCHWPTLSENKPK